ncbi:ribosomal RNA large subunit methyltransferase H [Odoribacter laneus]|jgi:ribosomal RNA large subunit methyltransferase H|uniref:Ribosomal RNA large subunit methyltransferase H n=1 Tax=Odoribacter laneus YIT 12061 TaxID=742817 RepID=H1DI52_9BACT|nr:23S rRNA (pseudouridine(1915)-N(3))-methyltransferase RlmH [Odoribacter laneus]EHP46464.1 rRNA large subunit m3Psi methyltransferase RlmH [Odoribacter laneus YIT 12061]GKI21489.1 ribosomal RNA large subunit methyltransferase H [Odoribacter laneus]GKI26071.1 ribosomal RNA large subunit methyltransferase H [Odoribacter laneus]
MKICLLVIGKTDAAYIRAGIEEYEKRMGKYVNYEMKVLSDVKNSKHMSEEVQKEKEGELLLEQLQTGDFVVLLDEKGKQLNSVEFSTYVAQKMQLGIKRMVFIIGGPYGFTGKVYERGNDKISLSKMTFSHQMVRMIFIEQLYRAMTIWKGEPYHHL